MAVNPAIALAVRPVEIADPMAMYGKIAAIQQAQNQNALAQFQLGAAKREEAATNALSQAYQTAYNPETGELDRNKLRQSLATGGFGAKIPTVEKALGELETQALTRQKTEGDLFDTSMKQIRNLWGNVRTPEDAMAVHIATHRDPIINKRLRALGITEEMGRQQILQAAQNPQTFAEFVQRAQLGAEKFMELNKPQLSTKDTGSQLIDRTFSPLTGEIRTISTQAKTMSPDASARLAFDRQKFAWEQANPGFEIKDTDTGYVAVNKRNPADVRPITMGAGGEQVASSKGLTEAQAKATGFAARAKEADKIISMSKAEPWQVATKQGVESIYGFGGPLGAVANVMLPEEAQKADQAQRDFVNAVLRQESGAAISESEFQNARKQYFPQPGDSEKVIKQKAKNRATVIQSLEAVAGPGMRKMQKTDKTESQSNVIDFGSLK